MEDVILGIRRARRAGVPLLAIETPDQQALGSRIQAAINGSSPFMSWDVIRGFRAMNDAGIAMVAESGIDPDTLTLGAANPVESLRVALDFGEKTVVLWANGPLFIADVFVRQGIANLRDAYKTTGRMLIMLGSSFDIPVELRGDVVTLVDPLPTDASVRDMITELCEGVGVECPDLDGVLCAVRGAGSLFGAEQIIAMSLTKEGVSVEQVWERKIAAINGTKGLGLKMKPKTVTVGGQEAIQGFVGSLMRPQNEVRPRGFVFIDEIEKSLGGLGVGGGPSDNTGVTQDTLGTILKWMDGSGERNQGLLLVGPPGTGKSLLAQALASTHEVPLFTVDLGAAKASLVGETETNTRRIFDTIDGVTKGGALVIATCNKLDVIPPELRRRFNLGTWFLDLPDGNERDAILAIQVVSEKVPLGSQDVTGRELSGWTGAEIRNVCSLSQNLGIPLSEARKYVIPVSVADPKSVDRLRDMAQGNWLSASVGGPYVKPAKEKVVGRKIGLEG